MITFTFEDGCVATLRTSGTEPKIKYYTEVKPDPQKGQVKTPSVRKGGSKHHLSERVGQNTICQIPVYATQQNKGENISEILFYTVKGILIIHLKVCSPSSLSFTLTSTHTINTGQKRGINWQEQLSIFKSKHLLSCCLDIFENNLLLYALICIIMLVCVHGVVFSRLDREGAQKELDDIVQCIIKYFYQPEKFGFIPRSTQNCLVLTELSTFTKELHFILVVCTVV